MFRVFWAFSYPSEWLKTGHLSLLASSLHWLQCGQCIYNTSAMIWIRLRIWSPVGRSMCGLVASHRSWHEVRCGTGLSRHRRQLAGVASKLYGYNVVTISRSTPPDYDFSKKTFYHLKASFTSRSLCSIFKLCHSLLTTQGGSPSRLLLQLRLLWTILATSSICAERRFRHGERHRIRRDGCGFGYWSRPPRQRRASSK